jgi:glucose-6-phosphate isomerase
MRIDQVLSRFDIETGALEGATATQRRLSDMRGCYFDAGAYHAALEANDPVIYTVASVAPGTGPGDLHYGLGRIMPGRIGREYYMTKGHLHEWRDAAEFYFGLAGEGMMLLEDEVSGESRAVPLLPNQAVYVPGHAAHRTMNISRVPLVYLGVYPAKAGHDYRAIAERNFRKVLIERDGQPMLVDRAALK